MATWQFCRYQKLTLINSIQDGANSLSVKFFKVTEMLKTLPPTFTYSLNLFLKRGTAFFCSKFSHTFSSMTIQKLFLVSDEAIKKLRSCIPLRTWNLQEVQIWRVRWSLLVHHLQTLGQLACRHCWATCAVCAESNAFHWICCSVQQQSIAVFNKL